MPYMSKRLRALIDRMEHWPKAAQEDAVYSLLAIEEEYLGGGDLSAEDRAALEQSAEDVRRGRFADDADVRIVFARHRKA